MDHDLIQMLVGLVVAITVLVTLVLRTRVHAFPALIIASLIAGTLGGYGVSETLDSIKKGFGTTLGSIGIIIGFGVIMGAVLEMSGAARRMALAFIRLFGKGREEFALAVTGFIVSIPIFCDSAFIILASLAKAISRNTGKSLTTLGIALASGLIVTHTLVPPTPGPLVVIANFGINMGSFIIWSLVIAIPIVLSMIIYARYIGTRVFRLPAPEGQGFVSLPYEELLQQQNLEDGIENLPSTFLSFLPIAVPLILIFLSTFLNALGHQAGVDSTTLVNGLHHLGNPVVAVGLGLLIGLLTLTNGFTRQQVVDATDESIKQAGIIIFVTGGGGALGMVLRDSGSGDAIAKMLVDFSIPAILLPIAISTMVRFVQGSGTVSLITSSAIVAPVVTSGIIELDPVLAALGCCVGGLFFSYFNDSYFWVVNRTLGIQSPLEQVKAWSITSTIGWASGVVILLLLNVVL